MLRGALPPSDFVASAYVAAAGGTLTDGTLAGATSITGPLTSTFAATSAAIALKLAGAFMSGGTVVTNKPQLLIEPAGTSSGAWNSGGAGTAFGINMPAASGFFFDFQVNGSNVAFYNASTQDIVLGNAAGYLFHIRSGGAIAIKSAGTLAWSSSGAANGTADLTIHREAASAAAVNGTLRVMSSVAVAAGGTLGQGYKFTSTANFGVFPGSGAPSISAAQGSLYMRSDGSSTSTRLYIAINSSGVASAWTGVTTAA